MRFAIYSRKSVLTGRGESIENQVELCRSYLAAHYPGVRPEEVAVYEDEGFSGKDFQRPQFRRMLEDIRRARPEALVCYRLDRVSRSVGDFADLIRRLEGWGVAFLCIREKFDTSTPMGKAMMYIASVFAQLERETIAQRVRDNMCLLARTGRWLGGTTPTGFRAERTAEVIVDGRARTACRLVPDPAAWGRAAAIFRLFLARQSLSGLSRALAEEGITARTGRPFSLPGLRELALGGTAVGTGLNAPKGFDTAVAEAVSELTGKAFVTAPNKFHALTSRDELVFAHGALQALAGDLMKLANDIRWLGSGPRNGLGELFLPENEPGSSIMPGKVNPTQCEALTMIAVQVMANGAGIGFAASQGNFELNVFLPVLAHESLQSARLLAEGMRSFRLRCADGIRANRAKMAENLRRSLMLVTALSPTIGYEAAAETAKLAHREDLTLREACLRLGYLTGEQFDALFHPEEMV